ncbi:MAG TPA: nucleotidyltransferase family protein [Gemmatimonadales bacterium]
MYRAVGAVARGRGIPGDTPRLLERLGLRGFIARHVREAELAVDAVAARTHRLYDTLLAEAALEISVRLTVDRIPHCFAKGTALLGSIYRPGDRVVSDIDLYVTVERLPDVLAVLEGLRYVPLGESDQAGPHEMRSALALVRPGSGFDAITVDLHWAMNPVWRLLPRPTLRVPDTFWARIDQTTGPLPVPCPEDHAALLVHHLVSGDLLHIRGLIDLAHVFGAFRPGGADVFRDAAGQLGVGSCARAVAAMLTREFGIAGPGAEWEGGTPLHLDLEGWVALAVSIPGDVREQITVARIRRRLWLVDDRAKAMAGIAADVVFPPRAFLRWRWPEAGPLAARLRHLGQVGRKMWGG